MRALYIAFEEIIPTSGISKKIIAQYEAFNSIGIEMSLLNFKKDDDKLYSVIDNEIYCSFGSGKFNSIKSSYVYNYIHKFIKDNAVKFIYIRYIHFASPQMLLFLNKIKKDGVMVVMEVPTYPYDDEYNDRKLSVRLLHLIEVYSRKFLHKYIDRIVTVQNYNKILNIPAIIISNGIDINSIPIRRQVPHDGINFVGVANAHYWHGYDRLIKGMGQYYQNGGMDDINFFIIGRNDYVIKDLLETAQKYKIEDKVHFEGPRSGRLLDSYFDTADLAIGSLGAHRKGVYEGKALKCVEYAARGIPFVYSDINPDFDNRSFIKKVSQDDTPIDVNELLVFIEGQKTSPVEIRQYVVDNLTWDIQMKKVIDEIS